MSRSQRYKYLISDKLCKKFGVAIGAEKGQSTQRNKTFPRGETAPSIPAPPPEAMTSYNCYHYPVD